MNDSEGGKKKDKWDRNHPQNVHHFINHKEKTDIIAPPLPRVT